MIGLNLIRSWGGGGGGGEDERDFATFVYLCLHSNQSLPSHKLVYNGGFSNFELLLLVQLLVWNSTFVAQILCGQ